jgi:hypothetical protein
MQPVPDLQGILAPIPWVLVGGLALRAYIPERMTLDIDILIHERHAEAVRAALLNDGYQVTGVLSIGGFSVHSADQDAPPIDVLTRADTWLDTALKHPSADAAGYPVLSRSYLSRDSLPKNTEALSRANWPRDRARSVFNTSAVL